MLPVLTPEEAAAWDHRATELGVPLATLMESAGRAVLAVIAGRYPETLRAGVLVAAGTGHNGGDGWVLARALQRAGVPVWVAAVAGDRAALTAHMAALARGDGVREVAADGPWPNVGLLVDALLGGGAHGAPRAPVQALVDRLHDLALPIVAIDGPTGLDLQSGVVHGAARADVTVTFAGVRRGHLLARDETGDLVVVDVGHPGSADRCPLLVDDAAASEWLPALPAATHKAERGRVVIVGGAAGMSGAIRMAGRAAFGAGAGLVHAVAPESTVADLVLAEPDLQTAVQDLDADPAPELLELVRRGVLVIGPGLGRSSARRALVLALVAEARAAVLDADALTLLADGAAAIRTLAGSRALVLTPHRGEFRTVFPALSAGSEVDPWRAAEAAAAESGATVLLKGVPTVVARTGRRLLTVAAGNPGLATGGSGDIRAGLVGAFLAGGLEPDTAAALGAQTLGRAADLAARRTTARGLRPMDVVAALPDLWREWRTHRLARPAPRPPVLLELSRPRST